MIILASGSPRRWELLTKAGLEFEVFVPGVPEDSPPGVSPGEVVKILSERKALEAFKAYPDGMILAADTVVSLDDKILGKPKDADGAFNMLKELSGRVHNVFTGVTLLKKQKKETFACKTEVEFYDLSDGEINAYIETREPFDKAGAYGIQGRGALFVKRIDGDYCNVVGLPLAETVRRIFRF